MWVSELDSMIYTILKTKLNNKFKKKYKNLYVTNSSKSADVPKFPTVYFDVLEGSEIGKDLSNTSVNGVSYNYQLSVTTLDEIQAKEIIDYCIVISKQMRFSISSMPIKQDTRDTFVRLIRCNRVFGANDIL